MLLRQHDGSDGRKGHPDGDLFSVHLYRLEGVVFIVKANADAAALPCQLLRGDLLPVQPIGNAD